MTSTTTPLGSSARRKDVLAHLPATITSQYSRRQTIYGPATSSRNIYLVITGSVGISQVTEDGRNVLLEIVGPEGRSEEHTSELQSRFGTSYAVFCLKKSGGVQPGRSTSGARAHLFAAAGGDAREGWPTAGPRPGGRPGGLLCGLGEGVVFF